VRPEAKLYAARILCVMVAVPLAFLVLYPLAFLLLPDSLARVADLPQDLTLLLLFDGLVVPAAGIWYYRRARRRGRGCH